MAQPIELQRGEVVHYIDGQLQRGPDDRYFDGDHPERDYVEADTFAAARRGPELHASSPACRVVTLYDNSTGTGGLVHIDAADIWSERGFELIDNLRTTIPVLQNPAIRPHVFGDGSQTSPLGEEADRWNLRIADGLRRRGYSEVTIVSGGSGKDVYLATKTGKARAFDEHGTQIHPPAKRRGTPPGQR